MLYYSCDPFVRACMVFTMHFEGGNPQPLALFVSVAVVGVAGPFFRRHQPELVSQADGGGPAGA